jgi:hypothetical protein
VEQVGCFIGHQEFGAIRCSKNQRTRSAQAAHDDGVFCGNFALAEQAADLAFEAGRGYGGLDRYGQAVEWSSQLVGDGFEAGCIGADAVGVEIGEDIEDRVETGYLVEVGLGEVTHGDFAGSKEFKLPDRRLKHELTHGWADPVEDLAAAEFAALPPGAFIRSSAGVDGRY